MSHHRNSVAASCVHGLLPSLLGAVLACAVSPLLAADDVVALASSGTLAISEVTLSKSQVPRYETVEYTFRVAGQWENPFDPDEVRVDAVITGEDGMRTVAPGFFYQEYRRSDTDGRESYHPAGDPCWKVRFAPPMPGRYLCELTAKNGDQEIVVKAPAIDCTAAGDGHGYLRISPHNSLYFEFDDGTPFCAVAMDKALGTVSQFEQVYKRFAESGGNFNRLFLTHGNLNIMELVVDPTRPDKGVERSTWNTAGASIRSCSWSEQLGIYHMLTLTNQTNFRTGNGGWDANVYNVKNGGFLNKPASISTTSGHSESSNTCSAMPSPGGARPRRCSRGTCGTKSAPPRVFSLRPLRSGTSGWRGTCGPSMKQSTSSTPISAI